MEAYDLDILESGVLSKLMTDYLEGHPSLRPFYSYAPDPGVFSEIISNRSRCKINRELLADALDFQHQDFYGQYPDLEKQVSLLRSEDCFTITTGHQLCLATGPLFFLYKIITAINTCKRLKSDFPDKHFVPVYWMASEDHDIEEVNHFYFANRRLSADVQWQGPVGRQACSGLSALWKQLKDIMEGKPFIEDVFQILNDCYLPENSLSEATRRLILHLFASEGLLVIDADRHNLKKAFVPVMREELLLHSSAPIVNETTRELAKHYKVQAVPREINLFYVDDQIRERIVQDAEGNYLVLNTDLRFSREFILDLLEKQPERFSPNVILRPLYQELLLPNLGTVLGPGETAYWLQLPHLFEHHGVHFPMLVPRNNALIINRKSLDKFLKIGFKVEDVFHSFEELSQQWLLRNENFEELLNSKANEISRAYDELALLISTIDPTLEASVRAEQQKTQNGIGQLSKKGLNALKRKHEAVMGQIRVVTENARPDGEHQERVFNFLTYYSVVGPKLIQSLLEELHPFSSKMIVLVVD